MDLLAELSHTGTNPAMLAQVRALLEQQQAKIAR